MGAAVADRVEAILPLDDEGAVAYCRLWQRGLRVTPTADGNVAVGPSDQVTDEVRSIVKEHKAAIAQAAQHRAAWAREPWSEERCCDLVQTIVRGMADPAVELVKRVSADEIRAGATDLPPKERKLALAIADYDEAWARVRVLRAAGEDERAKAVLHSDYWRAGDALRALMESEWHWRMPSAVAVLTGSHPAWAACEGILDDAMNARSMDAVWLACLAMRYAAAVAKAKRVEKEVEADVW